MEAEERRVAAGVSFSLTLGLQAGDLVLSSLCPPPFSQQSSYVCLLQWGG